LLDLFLGICQMAGLYLFMVVAVPQSLAGDASPLITGFAPTTAPVGTLVIVNGSNLLQVMTIQFGGVEAPVYGGTDDGTEVQTEVPPGATDGPITVVTANGIATSSNAFLVVGVEAPVVTGFSPGNGPPGTQVTLSGSNLVGLTAISFNGSPAEFSTIAGVSALVPTSATTGPITVTAAHGSFTTANAFIVTAAVPSIANFTPPSGPPGTQVQISGANLSQAKQVTFGGVASTAFSSLTDTLVIAAVPLTATNGPIAVVCDAGKATSAIDFTVLPMPTPGPITFTPAHGRPGDDVMITGTNLMFLQKVQFNGVDAAYSVITPTQVSAMVPYAPSGPITVVTTGGSFTTPEAFVVDGGVPPPQLTSIQPASGPSGTLVLIKGAELDRVSAVLFNGTAARFNAYADGIVAEVPPDATAGPVTINAWNGQVVTTNDFDVFNSGELGLVGSASRDPVVLGQAVTFSITLTNLSGRPMDNLILSNSFAMGSPTSGELVIWTNGAPAFGNVARADMQILSVNTSQGSLTVSGTTVVCNAGTLEPAKSMTIQIEVEPGTSADLHHLGAATAALTNAAPAYASFLTSVTTTNVIQLWVRSISPTQLEVNWPILDSPMILQSADTPTATALWSGVTNSPVVVDGHNSVTLPAGLARQFYRLTSPAQ
jgi:hypothetical protein